MAYVTPLVSSFIQFLNERLYDESLSADTKESIDTAIQCLETAFSITAEYSQLPLKDIFIKAMENKDINLEIGKNAKIGKFESKLFKNEDNGLVEQTLHEEVRNCSTQAIALEKALGKETTKADYMKTKGDELMEHNSHEEALKCYTQAIAFDELNAVYFCKRADALIKINKFDEAIKDCKQAVKIDPEYVEAYGRMGLAYDSLGQYISAEKYYKQALELDPANEGYQTNLNDTVSKIHRGTPSPRPPFELTEFLNNPALLTVTSQILSDTNVQTLLSELMPGGVIQGGGGELNNAPRMDPIFQAGQRLAAHLEANNPDICEQIRRQIIGNINEDNQGEQNPISGDGGATNFL